MVEIKSLTMRYPTGLLFENVNLSLKRGEKYGLIGANGAGKSTFLKIIAGQLEATSGEVSFENGVRYGVLEQNQFAYEDFSLRDAVLYGNKRLYKAVKEKEQIYATCTDYTDEINNRLSELEMICAEEDPNYECDTRCEKILSSLNLHNYDELMKNVQTSDKFKVLIAQVLFAKPDVLFLDEPTNNLDLDAINWLENELKRHDGTMVVISHDRFFLNSICTRMLDVDFKQIREFAGNYDDWYMQSTLIKRQKEAALAKNLKEKEALEKFIARFSANASKARQATSRAKNLAKLDVSEIEISSRRDPSILFRCNREIGNEVLELSGISKAYDKQLFKDLNLKVNKGDKIAIIGASGAGKSTLAKIIMGELKPDSGEVKLGATIEPSYFPQDTSSIIVEDVKLYDFLISQKHKDIDEIRKCLGRMLFSGADQEKHAKDLSGGEKHRLMLSKMMLERGNFILLDEPNNHLDLEAIISLGEALYDYDGVAICISHDRELINSFANRIWHLKDGELIDFAGTYEEFLLKYEGEK